MQLLVPTCSVILNVTIATQTVNVKFKESSHALIGQF